MKKILKYISVFIIFMSCFNLSINADTWTDYNGGSGTSLSLGKGSWSTSKVGIKVSIVSYSNGSYTLKDSEIILNKDGANDNYYFSITNSPKMLQSNQISWIKKSSMTSTRKTQYSYTLSSLPSNWLDLSDNGFHSLLVKDNKALLKEIVNYKYNNSPIFTNIQPDDYVVIEPMTSVNYRYGTAYELTNAFYDGKCSTEGSFCYEYSQALLCYPSSQKKTCKGIFYNYLYLETNVIGLTGCSGTKASEINACFKNQNYNRGVGVFKYSDIYPPGSLEITKKETGTTTTISGAGFTLYSDSSCKTKVKDEVKTNTNGIATFTGLNADDYWYKETTVPSGYTGDSNCHKATITSNNKTTATVYNTLIPQDGNITIKIMYGNNTITSPNSQAKFNVYSGSGCSGTLATPNPIETRSGQSVLEDYDIGEYTVCQVEAPNGFVETPISNGGTSQTVTLTSSGVTVTFKYTKNCDTELAASDKSVASLLNLYNTWKKRGLLNFQNPSCSAGTPPSKDIENLTCLSGSTLSHANFHEKNLSSFDEEITDSSGNSVGFCLTSVYLKNNLGAQTFYSKAGQFLIKEVNDEIQIYNSKYNLNRVCGNNVATATLRKRCYVLGGSAPSNANYQSSDSINVYFGDNDRNGNTDRLDTTSVVKKSANTANSTTNNFLMYEYEKVFYYKLNTINLENISGESSSSNVFNNYVKGVISKFNSSSGSIPFSVTYRGKNYGGNNLCKYYTK